MKEFILTNAKDGTVLGVYSSQGEADTELIEKFSDVPSTRTTEVDYKPKFKMTPQKERLLNRLRDEDVYAFDDFGTLSENGKAIEEEPWGAIEYLLDCLEQERG